MLSRGASIPAARSAAVNALVAGEFFYLFNSRFIIRSSFTIKTLVATRAVLIAVIILALLQACFTYLGFMQRSFGVNAISAGVWGRIAVYGVALFLIVEAEKAIVRSVKSLKSKTDDKIRQENA